MYRFDPIGFPVVHCPPLGLGVGLLPVMRAQFEYFLGSTSGFPREAFDQIEQTAPRASWRTTPDSTGVFLSGIRPEEAELFARWIGYGFRLPTAREWRTLDRAFVVAGQRLGPIRKIAGDSRTHPAARAVLDRALAGSAPTWGTAGRLEGGLLEWVVDEDGVHRLHGRPRTSLIQVVHNPQVHPAIEPTSANRHPAFGVRLVSPWPEAT